MTSTIAFIGKSGSGKTTLVKQFIKLLREKFKNSTILAVDNDLTLELSNSYSINTKNTIYGVKSGKHEYKTGIPEGMTKHEYVEWAIEDIITPLNDNTDIIVSWFVGAKDCRCPITAQINTACQRLIERYDFVIFDCEFDLKYLNQLVDTNIDLALIIANPTIESVKLTKRIAEFSAKYAAGGQLGVVVNKVRDNNLNDVYSTMKEAELDILGSIPYDETLEGGTSDWNSTVVTDAVKHLYFRLNLPQENN